MIFVTVSISAHVEFWKQRVLLYINWEENIALVDAIVSKNRMSKEHWNEPQTIKYENDDIIMINRNKCGLTNDRITWVWIHTEVREYLLHEASTQIRE